MPSGGSDGLPDSSSASTPNREGAPRHGKGARTDKAYFRFDPRLGQVPRAYHLAFTPPFFGVRRHAPGPIYSKSKRPSRPARTACRDWRAGA